MKMTPAQRDQIAADAAARYRPGATWEQIAADYGVTGDYVRRTTIARHDLTYRRWGQQPIADVDVVLRRREDGQTLDQIAEALGWSHQAVRTALETAKREPATRYPRFVTSPPTDRRRDRRGERFVPGVSARAT
ncbi:hypothetical protein [Brachybacterium fresconis]|uniref:Transcriptional regulator n=1 Tax=Brachybacterium fresconis TaxID=173363 RepID=A0ABS4YFI3_9MICO|nr:hypothetical protein [Brachybacterium fresconis]MBP2407552.1 putative transcriptional regulator [Brachybacterium fresconis]